MVQRGMQNCNRRNGEGKRKVVNERRRENEKQEYVHEQKEAHKTIKNNYKLYIKNVTESIEEVQKYSNTWKMYQTINQFGKGYQQKFNMIRNKKRRTGIEY